MAALALGGVFAACRVPEMKVGRDELLLTRVEMRVWRKDKLAARVAARELRLVGGSMTAHDVTARTATGEVTISKLEFDLSTTAATASGGVRGAAAGWTFSGSTLRLRRDRVVLCEAPFELTHGPFVRHQGRALEWDPVGAWAVVTGVASVMEHEGEPLTLSADRLLYRETQRTALATGAVVLGSQPAQRVLFEFAEGHEGERVSAMQVE
ncbi:MAG: hypothetical protein Q8L48_22350 [Archangium sp.]|nr:hypothetical protein [Archangium sp.]